PAVLRWWHLGRKRAVPRHLRTCVPHGRADALLIQPGAGTGASHPSPERSREVFGGFMNLNIKSSALLAMAAIGFVATGCDSIKDVRRAPSTQPPGHTGVLDGIITGLAPVRGVVLHAGMEVEGYNTERVFFGALGPDQ